MENLKKYLIKNSEQMLALVILVGVPTIAHLIPYKLVFLNFFFIVILFSVYFVECPQGAYGGRPHHLARCDICLARRALFPQFLRAHIYGTRPVDEYPGLVQFSDLDGRGGGKASRPLEDGNLWMNILACPRTLGNKSGIWRLNLTTWKQNWPTRVNYHQKPSQFPSPDYADLVALFR